MGETQAIQGELQGQVMAALWRLGAGSVEQVRQELAGASSGARHAALASVLAGLRPEELEELFRDVRA